MAGELGKASLDLEANLGPFERNVTAADATSDRLKDTLEALAAVANAAESALNDVKMGAGSATRSRISAEEIISGVHGIISEARDAAREIDRVHLSETQAAETEAAGGIIDSALNRISRNADQAKRKLLEVRLAALGAGGGGGGGVFDPRTGRFRGDGGRFVPGDRGGRNGVGVGPFGSGFGRVGALGAAIGVGALTAPAAAPAAVGLAGIPTLAAGAAGALGTLMLAFSGVGKAIGGDKKAFDALTASQKQFVQTVRGLHDWLQRLKQISAQSLFPGLTKGLKAALSPGTVNAIETALVQLGHALGSAGAAWGKYFGSPRFQQIFGPLMQSAARNIGVLSDAFLHLFDAFGVLARAAIPFTNWLNTAIDRGAKFADTWLRARDATGQLGSAMHEAQTSLKLIGGLALSLVRVVIELGAALYPVAKVAVKDLTDGLNGLAGVIHRNKKAIGEIAGALIDGLKVAIEGVVFAVNKLVGALSYFVGPDKARLIVAIGAIGVALALSLGPESAVIAGAIVAVGLIVKHWSTVKTFFVTLGTEIVNAFKYAWYELEKGALKAALAVVEPFSHLPSFLGGWARDAKDSMQKQLDRLRPPNMNWSDNAARAGATTGSAWGDAFAASARSAMENLKPGTVIPAHRAGPRGQIQGAYVVPKKQTHHRSEPKPGTHDWYMKYLGYDPTQQPTFGPPGPFTKNTGTGSGRPSVIPATAEHLIALAAQQASIAANAKSLKKEQTALNKEITDLEKADKILREKWRNAHGKAKTALFNEITTVENRIRAARKKLRDAGGSGKLDYALEQAKVAVENAKEGSNAWDSAVNAEEKDLKAEIRYWDRRAHNDKLGLAARTAALKKELSYQKQLKALLAPIKAAASANIAQFLSTFADIENTFAPNVFPISGGAGSPSGGSGKTDTHLHEIKNESRKTNAHLQAIRSQGRFPGSAAATDAAMAVAG